MGGGGQNVYGAKCPGAADVILFTIIEGFALIIAHKNRQLYCLTFISKPVCDQRV